jgi:hypothetical protein
VLQGLGSAVRYKAYKKRPLRSTRLTFGSDFSIGVQLFATIKVPADAVLHAALCTFSARCLMYAMCTQTFACSQMTSTTCTSAGCN